MKKEKKDIIIRIAIASAIVIICAILCRIIFSDYYNCNNGTPSSGVLVYSEDDSNDTGGSKLPWDRGADQNCGKKENDASDKASADDSGSHDKKYRYIDGSMFTLNIKGEDIPVKKGVSESIIDRQPGWLPSSAKPGHKGMCVVYGHRNRDHLLVLKELHEGDTFALIMKNKTILYKVEKIKIVSSDSALRIPITSESKIMLSTCYPFYYTGHAPNKWVVVGKKYE